MIVTGEQVRDAMTAAGIVFVKVSDCSICGYITRYLRIEDKLGFDPGCYCTGRGGVEPRSWDHAADWINMQTNEAARARIMAAFGLKSGAETRRKDE
jgi:hypothetical protein